MISIGPLAFLQPWMLGALALLPLIWWLIRVTPPAPRRQIFPAIRLLLGLRPAEETAARTPWWLLLLRLMAAALAILALAGPLLNPSARLGGSGPLVAVIDNGWASAADWELRQRALDAVLAEAERQSRPVILLATARGPLGEALEPSGQLAAHEARQLVGALRPQPWPQDRAGALSALESLELDGSASVVWLSDGLSEGEEFDRSFMEALQRKGALTILSTEGEGLANLLLWPESEARELVLRAQRAATRSAEALTVVALGEDGREIGRRSLQFEPGESEAAGSLELPVELRNRITRLAIEGERQAGAVILLDERWRRRPVGIATSGPLAEAQPLLSEQYYLDRALAPFTELRRGAVEELLAREIAVLALTDGISLTAAQRAQIATWIEGGGLLLRFAGSQLASQIAGSARDDELLPVFLRGGDRILGGALSWDQPVRLAPFERGSPFEGLTLPAEVTVARQVLAEPSLDLAERTWARLADGTPLVTATKRGEGWLVLFHTTANTDWSNLPISGLFVEMLRRIVALSQGVGQLGAEVALPPLESLDAFGALGPPLATASALDKAAIESGEISPRHPPGFYGRDLQRRAHNLISAEPVMAPLSTPPPGVELREIAARGEIDLKPLLLAFALILLIADLVISLRLRGLLRYPRHVRASLVLAPWLIASLAAPVLAQQPGDTAQRFAIEATSETHLAYVLTGVPAIDEISRSGLESLTGTLIRRTSIEPGKPMAIDPEVDELAFFPLIYWPVTDEQRPLGELGARRVNHYLENGGTILFDLREPSATRSFGPLSRGTQALRRLAQDLRIPALVPVPPDHVLTKSFYLLQEFPGRFAEGQLWVETAAESDHDGVASVIVGSNDWAGAWAIGETGRPLLPVVPGGERQREMALRFGVNLVMYALTGNYKADQVHVPFILERLGQ